MSRFGMAKGALFGVTVSVASHADQMWKQIIVIVVLCVVDGIIDVAFDRGNQ